tara:strand:- start:24 stop:128 length:105 start_codon:yes stop_codon:yes gene_type:complete
MSAPRAEAGAFDQLLAGTVITSWPPLDVAAFGEP